MLLDYVLAELWSQTSVHPTTGVTVSMQKGNDIVDLAEAATTLGLTDVGTHSLAVSASDMVERYSAWPGPAPSFPLRLPDQRRHRPPEQRDSRRSHGRSRAVRDRSRGIRGLTRGGRDRLQVRGHSACTLVALGTNAVTVVAGCLVIPAAKVGEVLVFGNVPASYIAGCSGELGDRMSQIITIVLSILISLAVLVGVTAFVSSHVRRATSVATQKATQSEASFVVCSRRWQSIAIVGVLFLWLARGPKRVRLEVTSDSIWVFGWTGAPRKVPLSDISRLSLLASSNYGGVVAYTEQGRSFNANRLMLGYRQLIDYFQTRRPDRAIPESSWPL